MENLIDKIKKKTFGLISLGCDKNRVDGEKLLAFLTQNDCKISSNIDETQILIINTCSFLNSSRQEAIETIIESNAYKEGKLEKIVVTGCLPEKFIDELYEPLLEGDVFLGIDDYASIFEALEMSYQNQRVNFVHKGKQLVTEDRVLTTLQHFAYLKIAEGCNNHCTYCLIPKIRGKYRSTPIENLVKEAENLGEIQELILVAQDCTRYGIDLYGKSEIVKLINELAKLDNISHIRLLYCYPDMITDELVDCFNTCDKLLKYIDIPLQHSEDRILKLMNRKGSRGEYLSLIEKLKREVNGIAIRSTFITGFPSEKEIEVEGLIDFLKRAKLTNCGFFAYSREKETPAYQLKEQVKEKDKKTRVKKLYEVQSQISKEFLDSFVGKKINVLCDGIDYEKNCFIGRAYFNAPDIDGKVYFNSPFAEQGEIYEIIIDSNDCYDLYGHTEDYDYELTK